ncbi:hypothetical protein EV401DRAFT_1889131 [Pisolithus croceorrhizus]|nr:hypothetical protein EV401DRAFT_1889131 [Pisolithus croceorrhizus]
MRPAILCFFVASLLSVVAGAAVGSNSWSFASLAQKQRCTPTGKFCPGYGEANCCSGKCNVLRGPGFVRIGICSFPSGRKIYRGQPLRILIWGECFALLIVYMDAYF